LFIISDFPPYLIPSSFQTQAVTNLKGPDKAVGSKLDEVSTEKIEVIKLSHQKYYLICSYLGYQFV
jgi:hypothetical protein